jgi:hypothetical protein
MIEMHGKRIGKNLKTTRQREEEKTPFFCFFLYHRRSSGVALYLEVRGLLGFNWWLLGSTDFGIPMLVMMLY